jgi:hypothetical protein
MSDQYGFPREQRWPRPAPPPPQEPAKEAGMWKLITAGACQLVAVVLVLLTPVPSRAGLALVTSSEADGQAYLAVAALLMVAAGVLVFFDVRRRRAAGRR